MSKNKKYSDVDLNAAEMSFTKHGFYDDEIESTDNYARYYFTPENTEVSGDFYPIAKCIMDVTLQPYQTITYVQSLDPRVCCRNKYRTCDKMRHFTERYYEYSEAHGLTENMFLDDTDKIIIISKGLNMPITKLSIETVDSFGAPKELCSYYTFGYKELPPIKSLSEAKSLMDSMTHDILIEYNKYPDYLSIIFDKDAVNVNDIVDDICKICKQYGKTLRIGLS